MKVSLSLRTVFTCESAIGSNGINYQEQLIANKLNLKDSDVLVDRKVRMVM